MSVWWYRITDDERALVNAFNRYFDGADVAGVAHRQKQSRFTSQLCDVLVDSAEDAFYLAIEAKSIKTSATNKLYFSQHFSESNNGHQVDRMTKFVERSGRSGYLFVELKRGIGYPRRAFMIPWATVKQFYDEGEAGIPLSTVREHLEIDREGTEYSVQPYVDEYYM